MADPAQPSLREYGLIGDGIGAALVSARGSVDWCCLPRMDSGSCFARLLGWQRGGHCAVEAADGEPLAGTQRYLDDTLVLETTLTGRGGRLRVLDLLPRPGDRRLLRVLEGLEGELDLVVRVSARFDYGEVRPWVRERADGVATVQGGDDAIVAWCEAPLRRDGEHDLVARLRLPAGERVRLSLAPAAPADVDAGAPAPDPAELDRALEATVAWWRAWAGEGDVRDAALLRSALTLRALVFEPTGAIAAAPTTSLPEHPGGVRNWDYRFSWVRDSTFTARSLGRVGYPAVADGFARFVLRTAAGHADELQVLYGLGGERRIGEGEVGLAGYHGSRPVRVGNGAATQLQRDELGELLQMCWRWHERGHRFDDDEWRFVCSVVEQAVAHWHEPDQGFWEWRGAPRHFVHSKASCWGTIDRGLALAEAQGREVPAARWARARDEVGAAVLERGFDRERRTFVQAFDFAALDAVSLLLPVTGLVAYEDERMRGTVDAVRAELGDRGLLRRYVEDDGLPGREGAFLACSFWLAECLARQGRLDEARDAFGRAMATATPLGLFAEEADPATDEPLGNFPQGLTHLSHITAALALREAGAR